MYNENLIETIKGGKPMTKKEYINQLQEEIYDLLRKKRDLQQRIDNAINYIKWHYDLGTKENVEFCLLRDRLLEILGDKENE